MGFLYWLTPMQWAGCRSSILTISHLNDTTTATLKWVTFFHLGRFFMKFWPDSPSFERNWRTSKSCSWRPENTNCWIFESLFFHPLVSS
jgi:hypothetical protein